jgi:hypothetical protein
VKALWSGINYISEGNPWITGLCLVWLGCIGFLLLGLLVIPVVAAFHGEPSVLWFYAPIALFSFVMWRAVKWDSKKEGRR